MTQGKTPVIGYGSGGHYIFCEERNSYMNVCGIWHKSMTGSGGTYFSSRQAAEQALSRATNPNTAVEQLNAKDDGPTLWRDMTPEQKGALLLAHHEGREIEFYNSGRMEWQYIKDDPLFASGSCYRIRPEPKRETVKLWMDVYDSAGTHGVKAIGAIDTIDGQPVADSVKLTPL